MKSTKFKRGLKRKLDNAEFGVHTGVRYKKKSAKKKIKKLTFWGKIVNWLNTPI